MNTTIDRTWEDHIKSGTILSQFKWNQYGATLLKVNKQNSFIHYIYRLLLFPFNESEPLLSFNLEVNPLTNTCCLGVHTPEGHVNHGEANPAMSEQDFRNWAMETLYRYLSYGLDSEDTPGDDGPIYRNLCQQMFYLSHRYNDLKNSIENDILSSPKMLMNSDYHGFNTLAKEVYFEISEFKNTLSNLKKTKLGTEYTDILNLLYDHCLDLQFASDTLVDQTELIEAFATDHSSVKWSKILRHGKKINKALKRCQKSGDLLTERYHVYWE